MLRRGFSYTAKFLDKVKLTAKEAKPTPDSRTTIKFALQHAATPFPDTFTPMTHKVLQELDQSLPGEGPSHSPKLHAHIASVNPSLQSAYKEEERAEAWVKEFMNPGPAVQIPKDQAITSDSYPGVIPFRHLLNFQKQIASSGEKWTRGNKRQFEQLLLRPKPNTEDVKYYPGSVLGSEPQDDPEAWVSWFINNQPKSLYPPGDAWSPEDIMLNEEAPVTAGSAVDEADKEEEDETEEKEDWEREEEEEDEEGETAEFNGSDESDSEFSTQGSGAGSEEPLNPEYRAPYYPVDATPETFLTTEYDFNELRQLNPDREYFEGDNKGSLVSHSPVPDPDDLPIGPNVMATEHEKGQLDIDRWAVFRMMPKLLKYKENIGVFLEELMKKEVSEKYIGLPSVIPYFETLPKWYQEQRIVQGFATNLERYKPEMTRFEKEEMLNLLCYYLTPKDPKRLLFLQEHYQTKFNPTLEQLEAGNQPAAATVVETQEKDEEVEETTEMKILKILGEESGAKEQGVLEIGEIEDYGVDWFSVNDENPKGKLPITLTYYDNPDGYWDEWIRSKRDRYGPPEIVTRKHFRH